jgi:hypothetical protein
MHLSRPLRAGSLSLDFIVVASFLLSGVVHFFLDFLLLQKAREIPRISLT